MFIIVYNRASLPIFYRQFQTLQWQFTGTWRTVWGHFKTTLQQPYNNLTTTMDGNYIIWTLAAQIYIFSFIMTRKYCPLCGPYSSSCGGLWPSDEAFLALWETRELLMLFWPILGHFWCSIVPLVTFSCNFEEKDPKNPSHQKKYN